jgi:hypothetical protein
VFLWGGEAEDSTAKSALKSKHLGAPGKDFAIVRRSSRVGGQGTAIVAPSLASALHVAEACAAADPSLRIICDFGPVLGAEGTPDEKLIGRLRAGSDMPGFPASRPLATLNFTTQAVVEFGASLTVHAVGRAEEGEGAKRQSGLPVYRIRLEEARQL